MRPSQGFTANTVDTRKNVHREKTRHTIFQLNNTKSKKNKKDKNIQKWKIRESNINEDLYTRREITRGSNENYPLISQARKKAR